MARIDITVSIIIVATLDTLFFNRFCTRKQVPKRYQRCYVAAKATYIRLLFGKMGVFRP